MDGHGQKTLFMQTGHVVKPKDRQPELVMNEVFFSFIDVVYEPLADNSHVINDEEEQHLMICGVVVRMKGQKSHPVIFPENNSPEALSQPYGINWFPMGTLEGYDLFPF